MKLAYVDASVWIARQEGIPEYREVIDHSLQELEKDNWIFCISEAVLLEVMIKPYRENRTELIQFYNSLFDQVKSLKSFPHVFRNVLVISQSENLKGMDAIHVAIASHSNCKCFVSTDPHFKNLKLVSPYWINLQQAVPKKT